jgi:hypothetical protein
MDEIDVVSAALCMASPFCAVAGLLSGLLWRMHFALGLFATLATVWFLTVGLLPIMLVPTIAAALIWTAIGAGVARLFLGNRHRHEPTRMSGANKAPSRASNAPATAQRSLTGFGRKTVVELSATR